MSQIRKWRETLTIKGAIEDGGGMHQLRLAANLFLSGLVVGALGLAANLLAHTSLPDAATVLQAVVLTGLLIVALAFPLQFVPKTKLTLHTAVLFAAIALFEPGIAALVGGVGALLAQRLRRQPWDQTLFNSAQLLLQAAAAGLVLALAGWNFATLTINQAALVGLLCVAAAVMYLIEVTAVATMIGLQLHQSLRRLWQEIARYDCLARLAQFGLGLLIAMAVDTHLWAFPLLLPLAMALYRLSEHQLRLGEQTAALGYQAMHDPLTQLPNRVLFVDRLQQALVRAARHHTYVAVLFLDLDRFKVINDSLGHAAGDQLLVAVAARLREHLRPEDTVARLGGDEFTIVLEDITQVRDATQVAERVAEAVQTPLHVQAHDLVITTSIGIALSTAGQDCPTVLLRNADVAMYRAKAQGPGRYAVFDVAMSAQAMARLQLETELRHAIEQQALEVYYQPMVKCTTGQIVGFEALVRWPHPQRGLLTPAAFIPLAEETGLIRVLGRWVLAEACRQARAWQVQYPGQPLTISVNLSVKEFHHPGLVQEVVRVLRETGLAASSLVVEITESAAMQEVEIAIDTLQQLKALGVVLAIDDFGTGYSSLAYLKRLPIDVLKIDRSFVARLGHTREDKAIVAAIIGLAQTLQLRVTGEGIETAAQLAQLRALRCDLGQGYYIEKPLPAAAAEACLAAAPALMVQEVAGSVV